MMRKKVYFDIKLRNHATMAFCSKISISIFFFLESHSISFLKIATESFKFANSCAVRLQKQQFIAPNASNLRRHD